MNDEVKEIIIDLMTRLWQWESKHFKTAVDRNIFEAEMEEIYERAEKHLEDVIGYQQYLNDMSLWEERNSELREEIESLEEALGDALSKNEDLVTTLDEVYDAKAAYFRRLQEISKVVNDTWS